MPTQLTNSSEQLNDSSGGWIPQRNITWIRTGNHTLLVSGNLTGTYQPGTKLWYRDNGVGDKYGVVGSNTFLSGTTTTLNLIPNTDFIASGTISSPNISYVDNPVNFPQWFNWSLSTSNLTVGTGGTIVSKWRAEAKLLHYEIAITLGTAPTVGDVSFTPVINSASIGSRQPQGVATLLDAGVQNYYGVILLISASSFNIRSNTISGSQTVNAVLSSTSPFTWGSGDAMYISGWYPY